MKNPVHPCKYRFFDYAGFFIAALLRRREARGRACS